MSAHFSHRTSLSRRSKGFTLIEVLIALLILAIGLLGVAGVQVLSMQNTSNANLRTLATIHAHDMAEQIRSNRGEIPDATPLGEWQARLARDLGAGSSGQVAAAGTAGFTITIQWVERDAASTGAADNEPAAGQSTQTFVYRLEI